jgi:hypothetical protein
MAKPHKWAKVIKAWADGKPIQLKDERVGEWIDYKTEDIPNFSLDYLEWRVKPENIVVKTNIGYEIKVLPVGENLFRIQGLSRIFVLNLTLTPTNLLKQK